MVDTRSRDGAAIRIDTVGTGPGVVIVHGGGVSASDYRRLATALSGTCTVHTFNRRGREDAASAPDDYGLGTELDDIRAVLEATGSSKIFGHSVGGFFALQAALHLPVDAVAVYDPAVAVDGLFPVDFFPGFVRAVEEGDVPTAFVVMTQGLQADGGAAKLPESVQRAIIRGFLRTPVGRKMGDLLPTVVREDRLALGAAGPATDYAGIRGRALFVTGTRSPRYYGPICDRLAEVVPGGEARRVRGASHNAPNIGRQSFAGLLGDFFGSSR